MTIVNTLYNRLIEVAQAGRTISRDEAAGLLGLDPATPADHHELTRILCDVSLQENAAGRPLLSAVVVLPEIGYPHNAFFLLARELGLNQFSDDRSFYYHELKRVHAYWKEHRPIPAPIAFQKAVERALAQH